MAQITAAVLLALAATAYVQSVGASLREDASARQASLRQEALAGQAAFFIRSLDNPRDRREARADILDTPVFPGSVVKPIALIAALERGVVTPDHAHLCRRTSRANGQTFVCAHPDLKRPLSLAETLAYSCNDFFVSLAPRLSREALNATRMAAGLPPVSSTTPMAPAIVGLEGPKTTPRTLVDVMARVVGAGSDKPVPMRPDTRAVVLQGLRGAADYGTASALEAAGVSALAKTGSIVMPNGTPLGLVVALAPADKPSHAIVVAAPGAAGLDAASLAAGLLETSPAPTPLAPTPLAPKAPSAPQAPMIRLGRTLSTGATRVETLALENYIAQVLSG
jgi:penicillin-binding protein 2